MNRYVFVIVMAGGQEIEMSAEAEWEKEARAKVWRSMTPAQCNACESIECVDVLLPVDPLAAQFRF